MRLMLSRCKSPPNLKTALWATGEAMHHNPHIGRSKIVSAYLMVKYLGAHQGFSGLLAESVVGALQ